MVELRKVVFKGVFWSFVNQVGLQLLSLVTLAFLARLLVPEDFGLIAMVAIAKGFLTVIKDFGFGAALVQKKTVDDDEYSTIFWLNIGIGLILTIILFFSAKPISLFYDEPKLVTITQVVSFSFLINAVGVVWGNIMLKNVDFKQIFYRNFLATLISSVAAVYFAWQGYGYWALVIQTYTRQTFGLLFNYLRVNWRPRLVFDKRYLADLMKFSLPLFADKSLNYWMRNVDNLVVGKFLGKNELAFYSKAYSLMLLPVKQLSGTITKVLFPSFSLIQDDPKRIGQVYLKISGVIAFVAFPVMIVLSITAEQFVLIVYGAQWKNVIPVFKVLSILGMFQAIGTLSGNIFLSRGKTLLMFKIGVFSRVFMILGVLIGLWYGQLMGMVYGYCITSFIAFIPELYFTGRIIELKLRTIIFNFLPYLLISAICYLIVEYLIPHIAVGNVFTLLYIGSVFVVSYLSINYLFKSKALIDLIQLVKNRKNSKNV